MKQHKSPVLLEKYGRLKIINTQPEITFYNSGRRRYKYICECICGKIIKVNINNLKSNKVTSCGCYRIEKRQLSQSESGFNMLYRHYTSSAKKRKLSFSLNKEEFKIKTSQNCFYCNTPPKQESYPRECTEQNKKRSMYIYNGLDRVNNELGYDLNNIVTCCSQCNYAKNTLNESDFKKWIELIYNNYIKGIKNV